MAQIRALYDIFFQVHQPLHLFGMLPEFVEHPAIRVERFRSSQLLFRSVTPIGPLAALRFFRPLEPWLLFDEINCHAPIHTTRVQGQRPSRKANSTKTPSETNIEYSKNIVNGQNADLQNPRGPEGTALKLSPIAVGLSIRFAHCQPTNAQEPPQLPGYISDSPDFPSAHPGRQQPRIYLS